MDVAFDERRYPVADGRQWPARVLVCIWPAADNARTWPGVDCPWAECVLLPGRVLRWLIPMGYRSTLAAVVASVFFAGAWAICDQLAGLGVGGSSTVAAFLFIFVFGLTLRLTRSHRPPVRQLRSAHAKSSVLRRPTGTQVHDVFVAPTARSGERGHQFPESPTITLSAQGAPSRERPWTLVTQQIEFVVDDAGMQVRAKRKTIGGEVWEEYLQIQ